MLNLRDLPVIIQTFEVWIHGTRYYFGTTLSNMTTVIYMICE